MKRLRDLMQRDLFPTGTAPADRQRLALCAVGCGLDSWGVGRDVRGEEWCGGYVFRRGVVVVWEISVWI
jgi:hypothetical protein